MGKGIERNWLAKKLSRGTSDLMNMELGIRAIPNIRTLKSWVHYLDCNDKLDTAIKLYMADGDKLEVDIRALSLEERLRLVAITNAFKSRKVHPSLIEAIDQALFEKPVVVQKPKHVAPGAKIGESPVMTEFDYNHTTGNVENIREYTNDEWKNQGQERRTGGSKCLGDGSGPEDP